MPFASLILCSDAESRDILKTALDSAQVKCELCKSTVLAERLLISRKFDLVFFEQELAADFQTALKTARRSELNRSAIFIAVVDEKSAASPADLGANLALRKPLSVELVSRNLEAVKGFVAREQRRHLRHNVELSVRIIPSPRQVFDCNARNISEGGICFHPSRELNPKQTVSVHFELPEMQHLFEAKGEIVWVTRDGHAGMRFLQVQNPHPNKLRSWLNRKLAAHLPGLIPPAKVAEFA
ncbi:MAG TPA: PilZ domain-containing protein [Terriglobales bacterium]|nr:PilZ domain-containing protein [Terriglobales bacterium]